MRERMTEFEYIIEYLDENDVARDADTQCFATHAEAERVAEHVLGNGQGRQGARLSRCQHPGTTSLMVSTIRLGEENLVEIFAVGVDARGRERSELCIFVAGEG